MAAVLAANIKDSLRIGLELEVMVERPVHPNRYLFDD